MTPEMRRLVKSIDAAPRRTTEELNALLPPSDAPWESQLWELRTRVESEGIRITVSKNPLDLGSEYHQYLQMPVIAENPEILRGLTVAGSYGATPVIWLRSAPASVHTYVLAHEYGHALSTVNPVMWLSRGDAELTAETFGYFLLRYLVPEWDNRIAAAYMRTLWRYAESPPAAMLYGEDLAKRIITSLKSRTAQLTTAA
jgi:hypothetical protein